MKPERNILIAFILNLSFAIFEIIGGLWVGSTAILSDAVHDMGDAMSIGLSYLLERQSKRPSDETYTYGYGRYSTIGSFITTSILLCGSVVAICNAFARILRPIPIDYDGMILLSVVGVSVNLCAAFFTRSKGSLNQKAVNLHMLEDVLGWIVVSIGAIVMRFTDLALIDPIMSFGVSLFILIHALKHMKEILRVFLEAVPHGMTVGEIAARLHRIEGVTDIHHIHLWSIDGQNHCATIHMVTDLRPHTAKMKARAILRECGIEHITIETETTAETCQEAACRICPAPHHHRHTHPH